MRFANIRWAILCAALSVIVALTGCKGTASTTTQDAGQANASQASLTDGLKKEGTLTIGIRGNSSAPFVVTSLDSTDTATGLDIDLGCALADELGLEPAFVNISDVSKALSGNCDVVMSVSEGNDTGYKVIGDYAASALGLFVLGDEPTVVSASDVAGERVAVQEGSSASLALQLTELECEEVGCTTLNEAFDMLEAGEVAYALCQVTSGAYLSSMHAGITFAGTFSAPVQLGLAVASGSGSVPTGIASAYKELQENGVLAEIRKLWLGSLPELTSSSAVANIPMRETEGESLEDLSYSEEMLSAARDGSTAGANAVSLSEVSMSSGGTSNTQTSYDYSYAPQVTSDYGYQYSDDSYGTDGGAADSYESYEGDEQAASASDYGQDTDFFAESAEAETTDYGDGGDYTESYE